MKNVLYTLFAISICLMLGKLANYLLAALPASLYGMIIYALFLQLNWFSPDKITKTNQWFIKHMGVCLVPAGMGIINHFQLIQQHGIALVVIIFSSTFILLTVIGYLSERYLITPDNIKSKAPTGSR
ncbi:CidA/LrgA family protein [Colwellia psychrerythraea]|uniref:LrgA family protein n=1 Tax=Colwellia psychrerythraea (strain 34H / ATCC BAA-681) TaxID=167879 RepID=Q486P2_COLP3|nr:CidA/LrgA family protein [Colwellia psychrerythraea]AAZ28803.1 LrgA family protein [Colwellia psychrerythraea 34H]